MGGNDASNHEQEPQHGNSTVENTTVTDNTATDYAVTFERVPKKREHRARWASLIICAIIGISSLIFYIVIGELYEKPKFSSLFTASLGLFSIVVGTLVDRLCLVAEEGHHLKERYGESRKKMLKACFSGIKVGPVLLLIGLTIIIVVVIGVCMHIKVEHWVQAVRYLVYVLSGIGVGPLIMQLLNLNTESEVHISTLLEEKGTCMGNIIAWSYYFNYLAKVLPKFNKTSESNYPVQEKGQPTRLQEVPSILTLNKLILLISHNCYTVDNLHDLDNHITKRPDICKDEYKFPVYLLKDNAGKAYTYVVQYAKEPLKTLYHLTHHSHKEKHENEFQYQIQLFYTTLSNIIKNPEENECLEKCILVPIKVEHLCDLENGGLVQLIRKQVEAAECSFKSEENDGFMKLIPKSAPQMTVKPEQSEPGTSTSYTDGTSAVKPDVYIVDMPPKGNIDYGRQYSKQCENSDDDANEHQPMLSNNKFTLADVHDAKKKQKESKMAVKDKRRVIETDSQQDAAKSNKNQHLSSGCMDAEQNYSTEAKSTSHNSPTLESSKEDRVLLNNCEENGATAISDIDQQENESAIQ